MSSHGMQYIRQQPGISLSKPDGFLYRPASRDGDAGQLKESDRRSTNQRNDSVSLQISLYYIP